MAPQGMLKPKSSVSGRSVTSRLAVGRRGLATGGGCLLQANGQFLPNPLNILFQPFSQVYRWLEAEGAMRGRDVRQTIAHIALPQWTVFDSRFGSGFQANHFSKLVDRDRSAASQIEGTGTPDVFGCRQIGPRHIANVEEFPSLFPHPKYSPGRVSN